MDYHKMATLLCIGFVMHSWWTEVPVDCLTFRVECLTQVPYLPVCFKEGTLEVLSLLNVPENDQENTTTSTRFALGTNSLHCSILCYHL